MTTLIGSDKQIAWATKIREGLRSSASALANKVSGCDPMTEDPGEIAARQLIIDAVIDAAEKITDAGWWIDNRDGAYPRCGVRHPHGFAESVWKTIPREERNAIRADARGQVAAARRQYLQHLAAAQIATAKGA